LTDLKRKPEVDYYKILQVDSEAEAEVIDAAYRALSKKYHPDVNRAPDAEDRMAQINSAYNVLSDASKRRDYNYLRKGISPNISHTANRPRPGTANQGHYSPSANGNGATNGNGSSTASRPNPNAGNGSSNFNPSSASQAARPAGATRPGTPGSGAGNNGSFRSQATGATSSFNPTGKTQAEPHIASRTGLNFSQAAKSRTAIYLIGFFVFILVAVGVVLALEVLVGNPLKTNFISQAAPTVPPASVTNPTRTTTTQATAPTATASPQTGPVSKDQVMAFLGTPDAYQGRVTDATLDPADTLQLKVKLAASGMVLNSETAPSNRTSDDLDSLRQSENTAYNLVYTLFARYNDLNRINLTLTDTNGNPVYRGDFPRSTVYTFYGWHPAPDANNSADVIKTARMDHQVAHFGTTLSDNVQNHINSPTDANLQAELQSIGLSAFTVTSSPQLTVNYFQVRNDAEMAVDFSRIFYTLYSRFPSIDKAQIIVSSRQDRPVKAIDRQLFDQIGLEAWSQASYGGPSAGGDLQAQNLVASLPGSLTDLKGPAVTVTGKYKTPVQVGSYAVVTENVERYDALALEGLRFVAGSGKQYLVVRVALKNGTDGRQWLFPGERMALFSTNGDKYNPDPTATLLYVLKTPPDTDPPPGPIDANKQGAVYVVFNVPSSVNLNTLRLQYTDGDKRALLELT